MTDRPGARCWHCESAEHDTAAHQHEPPVPPAEPVEREGELRARIVAAAMKRHAERDDPYGCTQAADDELDAACEALRSRPAAKGKAHSGPCIVSHQEEPYEALRLADGTSIRLGRMAGGAHTFQIEKHDYRPALPAGAVDEREALREASELLRRAYMWLGDREPGALVGELPTGIADDIVSWVGKHYNDASKGTP